MYFHMRYPIPTSSQTSKFLAEYLEPNLGMNGITILRL